MISEAALTQFGNSKDGATSVGTPTSSHYNNTHTRKNRKGNSCSSWWLAFLFLLVAMLFIRLCGPHW
uniref:Uncharacterized protein n=1 Tax=Meloidogyne enterolobii TaxID=390850 RepID=A0A6V7XQ06_MELEN|nr:unnamed protein product [Meloidogyne enterolobii]